MNIYEEVKKEFEEKNRLKIGDTCVYFGDIYNLVYCYCVVSNVLKNDLGKYSYVVKFASGNEEIVDGKDLVKTPGNEWQKANNISYLGNTVSSLPYIPYDYKKTQNLLYGVNGDNIDRPVVERCTFKTIKLGEEEKEMELKLGDRVRCIGGSLSSYGKLGNVVSINEYYDSEASDIGVKFDGSDWVTHFPGWTKSLELIEDNTKFKKGDRVVCVKQPSDANHEMLGLRGTALHSDSAGWTMVEFDENVHGHDGGAPNGGKHGHCWGMSREHLKLIDKEEEKNMLSFKIGDKVEYNSYYRPLTGKTFEVIGFKGRLGCSSIEVVIQNEDGDSIEISSKHLKLVSKKNEKGEKKMMFNFKVVGAYPNKKKGILAVKFNDGEVVKLACHDDDNFDINVGVALAMAYKSCGSKNAFRRNVEKVTQEVKSKEDKKDKVFVEKKKRGRKRKVLVSAIPEYTFGYKMKKARKSKNLTQKELALIIGAGTSTIHNYERNDCLPNPKRRAKIIEVLGLN